MANMTFKTNLLPNSTTQEYSLGSSTNKWKIYGDLIGNAEKVTQNNQTGAAEYRILLSGSANNTNEFNITNKSDNLTFNPSTKLLSIGGGITATGDLIITGNTNLNNETYADSLTAGLLLVTGNSNFTQIPTAPTPASASNDTSVATTAFVNTWAGSSNITKIGILSSGTVPWARLSGVPAGASKEGTVTGITAGTGLNTTSNDSASDGGTISTSGTLYLTKSGATAGSYGPSAAVTGTNGTTMNVPYITVDKYGRVTSISNKVYTAKDTTYSFTAGTSALAWNSEVTLATVGGLAIKAKLPANPNTNTDTLVKQTVKTDSVDYKLLTTTSASPSSGSAAEAAYSTDFMINPSTKTLKITSNTAITYNTTNGCLEIIVA